MSQHSALTFDATQRLGGDLEQIFDALHSGHIGNSRPAYAQAGMTWMRSGSGGVVDWFFYDGDTDVLIGTFTDAGNSFSLGRANAKQLTLSETGDVQLQLGRETGGPVNAKVNFFNGESTHVAQIESRNTEFRLTVIGGAQIRLSSAGTALLDGNRMLVSKSGPVVDCPAFGSRVTWTHGLPVTPIGVSAHLICTTTHGSWDAGDRVVLAGSYEAGDEGYTLDVTATQVRFRSVAGGFALRAPDGGTPSIIDPGNFDFQLFAWG